MSIRSGAELLGRVLGLPSEVKVMLYCQSVISQDPWET